ncbi:hypothetical protein CDAR_558961 [Caerostris darwini]|uniref:Uncharacterized protein n=1 Tax=Caerostris darwini TaxID=1538125 RepID=A0AAV4NDM5_9ARAC|nr:hypothetical protein CDAR_558961 [Caerostris darwini]
MSPPQEVFERGEKYLEPQSLRNGGVVIGLFPPVTSQTLNIFINEPSHLQPLPCPIKINYTTDRCRAVTTYRRNGHSSPETAWASKDPSHSVIVEFLFFPLLSEQHLATTIMNAP